MRTIAMYCDEYVDLVNELDRVGFAVFRDLSALTKGEVIKFYEIQDCYEINRSDGSTYKTRSQTGKNRPAKVMFSREAGLSQYDVYVARMDK